MTQRRATALGVAAIVLWGSTVAFGRSLTAQLGPLRAAGAVYALCAAISVGLLLARPARLREALRLPRRYLLVCGGLFVLYVVCFYLALGLSAGAQQAIEVGTVNYLWPVATVVLSVPILGMRARWTLWPGVLLALAGIAAATLSGRGWTLAASWESLSRDWLPYLLALVGALVWALYSNLSRRLAGGAGAGAVPLFMVATALVMGPLALAHTGGAPRWTLRTVAELVYLGVFPTTLGYAFWEAAMRRGNILRVATLSYITPLLAAAIAAAYLGAVPGPGLWLGCALVVVGAWVCQRSVDGAATPEGPRS